jgi:assimilatory nitrate reductase catalytic subunit
MATVRQSSVPLVTDRQRPGQLFVPMHWTDQFASNGRIDALVTAKVDPVFRPARP